MTNSYFLSGLPRSGSTFLYNVLKQNPALGVINQGRHFGTDNSLPELLQRESPKIVVTYRPILEVLASFIKLATQYPDVNFIDVGMKNDNFHALSYRPLNDARCDWLMRPNGGIDNCNTVFKNIPIFKEWFHLVNYNDLCEDTTNTMNKMYNFFEIDNFNHDFDNVSDAGSPEDEKEFGIPTLHQIRKGISKSTTKPEEILSEYVIQKYSNAMDFFTKGWLQSL